LFLATAAGEKISGFGLPQILSELLARDRRNESTG